MLYNFSAKKKNLKHIPDITYTLKIYNIVIHYKEFFLKHIPDKAYVLKICYIIF